MTLDGRCAKQIIGRAGIMPHTLRTQAYGVGSTPHARNSSPADAMALSASPQVGRAVQEIPMGPPPEVSSKPGAWQRSRML